MLSARFNNHMFSPIAVASAGTLWLCEFSSKMSRATRKINTFIVVTFPHWALLALLHPAGWLRKDRGRSILQSSFVLFSCSLLQFKRYLFSFKAAKAALPPALLQPVALSAAAACLWSSQAFWEDIGTVHQGHGQQLSQELLFSLHSILTLPFDFLRQSSSLTFCPPIISLQADTKRTLW